MPASVGKARFVADWLLDKQTPYSKEERSKVDGLESKKQLRSEGDEMPKTVVMVKGFYAV